VIAHPALAEYRWKIHRSACLELINQAGSGPSDEDRALLKGRSENRGTQMTQWWGRPEVAPASPWQYSIPENCMTRMDN
jgi:hypothetical protein